LTFGANDDAVVTTFVKKKKGKGVKKGCYPIREELGNKRERKKVVKAQMQRSEKRWLWR
jgi:hypothetical protein